jgi:serine/threonine-protein kinase
VTDETPERIGKYRVLRRLGKGGLGEVFLAQRDGDPRLCALKRLLPSATARGGARDRLLREAHVATFLDHPNIARVYGAGEEDGAFCIATELVPGRDAGSLIAAHAASGSLLEPRQVIAIGAAILDALAHAHAAKDATGAGIGLVHRDLTPRNVMVSFAGIVKVIDFGVARAKVDALKTAAGVVIGTPNYLSPEQAVADPIDHRSDLYSLGAVLYEMLTGRRVAGGKTPAEVMVNVVTATPPPPSALVRSLPPALDAVIMRALSKARDDRYPSAAAMREALAPVAEEVGQATTEELGALMRRLFPGDEVEIVALIRSAKQRFGAEHALDAEDLLAETKAREPDTGAPVVSRLDAVPRPPRAPIAAWLVAGALMLGAFVGAVVLVASIQPGGPSPTRPIAVPGEPEVRPSAVERAVAAPEKARPTDPEPRKAARVERPPEAPPPPAAPREVIETPSERLDGIARSIRALRTEDLRPADPRIDRVIDDLESFGISDATLGQARVCLGMRPPEECLDVCDEAVRALRPRLR